MAQPLGRTTRQRISDLLSEQARSARDIAELLHISVREVEEHLVHVKKTVSRNSHAIFRVLPSKCYGCGFVFVERTRLTPPCRCPQCRSESIIPPRYQIIWTPPQEYR